MIDIRQQMLPELPTGFSYRLDLAWAVTPRELKQAPIHRWFYFPHSFSPRLVNAIIDHWGLPAGSFVVDPFVGAGTTLLTACELGMDATGFDLSPLAIMVSTVKSRRYDVSELQQALQEILDKAALNSSKEVWDSGRLKRAFSDNELSKFSALSHAISSHPSNIREFFLLALLRTSRFFSRAIADGGWFRWTSAPDKGDKVFQALQKEAMFMIEDITTFNAEKQRTSVEVYLGDARQLSLNDGSVDGIVTSPPYVNRHDYTRVFHIELLLLNMSEQEITQLRHKPLRSHVEAKLNADFVPKLSSFSPPDSLDIILAALPATADKRIHPLLKGYFQDMYLTLLEARRVLKPSGCVALILGNVRHAGVMVPVDQIVIDIGQLIGLSFDSTWVVRMRGNSAQQMGRFGREPSRESIIFLKK
jgi:tRNA G10  N-methylase Trm11